MSQPASGASMGNKFKNAFGAVQGFGDTLRFGAMDFVDHITNTGGGVPNREREVNKRNSQSQPFSDHWGPNTTTTVGSATTGPTTAHTAPPTGISTGVSNTTSEQGVTQRGAVPMPVPETSGWESTRATTSDDQNGWQGTQSMGKHEHAGNMGVEDSKAMAGVGGYGVGNSKTGVM